MNKKYLIILILILINIVASFFTLSPSNTSFCSIGKINGCSIIEKTPYTTTLGIENGYFGIIGFSLLAVLVFSHLHSPKKQKQKSIFLLSLGISIIAIYFLFLQLFVIKTFCSYCLIIDLNCLIILTLQLKNEK